MGDCRESIYHYWSERHGCVHVVSTSTFQEHVSQYASDVLWGWFSPTQDVRENIVVQELEFSDQIKPHWPLFYVEAVKVLFKAV